MSITETIIYCVVFLGSMAMILFAVSGMKDDMPPLAFDDTITIQTQDHTDAWIEANSDPIPGDDSDFHPEAGSLWIPDAGTPCRHGWDTDNCGLCADAEETERATETEVMPAVGTISLGEAAQRAIDDLLETERRRNENDSLHVEVIDGELVPEEVTEFHPLKVVSDELGDWIPEAYTPATPTFFNDVLTARVRWGLIETFDSQLELTAA